MRLWRAHGLGNDYLVLEDGPIMTPALARAVCDRHRGVGSDGVLEPTASDRADCGVRIWNPDGSIAEKSGNGLRIFAQWRVDRLASPNQFTVDTGFDVVRCRVGDSVIEVEMGRASARPGDVPVQRELRDTFIQVGDDSLPVVAMGVGNPHCVAFFDNNLDELPWRTWGALLEVHPLFPNRTNVQFARVVNEHTVEIRIWERGAGETMASGSSSCAVAAAAVWTGRLEPGLITVKMPGGTLQVTVQPDLDLLLVGPVEVVGIFEVAAAWLNRAV